MVHIHRRLINLVTKTLCKKTKAKGFFIYLKKVSAGIGWIKNQLFFDEIN